MARPKNRARISAVRRAQAITLILALLGIPLVLLAQSGPGGAGCDRMCCLTHGHHAAQPRNEGSRAQDEEMTCHHGATGHMMECQMRASHHGSFSSPVAPIPPTMLSAGASIAAPDLTTEIPSRNLEVAISGFDSPPFEPPRL
jgi:hypothetical protein